MSYYGYHPRIKQRIRSGELVDHYFTDNYPGIGEALVLVFSTPPFKRPIRPHKYHEYVDILAEWARIKSAAPGCTRPESGRRE